MVQHRLDYSIYDELTAEGAARLIDGGSEYLFLYLCGARSATVSGKFDVAKNLYGVIPEKELETPDRNLKYALDRIEEEFELEKELRANDAERDDLPRVKIETTQGDIIAELYLNEAPSTVSHFLGLVKEGFYDEVDFHQVVADLLALTGDPTGLGDGGSGKYLVDEHLRENTRSGLRGSLVMAKKPLGPPGEFYPNSASSQFAILYLPYPRITDKQTVFGRIIEGMEVACRLKRVDPSEEKNDKQLITPPDRIVTISIIREPESLPEPVYFDVRAAIEAELEAIRGGQPVIHDHVDSKGHSRGHGDEQDHGDKKPQQDERAE